MSQPPSEVTVATSDLLAVTEIIIGEDSESPTNLSVSSGLPETSRQDCHRRRNSLPAL